MARRLTPNGCQNGRNMNLLINLDVDELDRAITFYVVDDIELALQRAIQAADGRSVRAWLLPDPVHRARL